MRTLITYLAFVSVALGTFTYIGQGITAGLDGIAAERNAQIESLRR